MKSEVTDLEKHLSEIDQEIEKLLKELNSLNQQLKQSDGTNELLRQKCHNLEKKISTLQKNFYLESIRKFFLAA